MSKAYCYNCGKNAELVAGYPIVDDLKDAWGLSDKLRDLYNRREGISCKACGANIRAQGLAQAILRSKYGYSCESLVAWVKQANKHKLAVCELNSCHELHNTLKRLKQLTYAEYGTKSEQNIENLSYKNNTFDLVLHSETLEHVNDPSKAMNECRRVLKDDGLVLFTTPVIWTRLTRQRAKTTKAGRKDILHPAYHGKIADDYVVYYEYGHNIDHLHGAKVAYASPNDQNYVFVSAKRSSRIHPVIKFKLIVGEKIALRKKDK